MNKNLQLATEFQPEIVSFLRDIIAIPSVSTQEGPVIQRIHQEMEKIGYDEIIIDGQGNLRGRIGSGKNVLVIDSHCDTVDVGNPDLWTVDPFEGDFRDGIVYGRGACDLKGGLASSVYAGKILKANGLHKDTTLWVSCTVQEEDCDGLCWDYIIREEGFRPNAALLTEPTNLNIYRGQRGRMEIKVKTSGLSCHGSAPERGVNAVYKMAPIIAQIEELHQNLAKDPFLGKGSVTISDVQSTSPSLCAVADSCTIHLDRRLTVGETIETSLNEIKNLPAFQAADAKAWVHEYNVPSYTGKEFPMQSYFPTWVLEEDHLLLQTAVASYKSLFDSKPLVDKWTFSTNGVATMGLHGIPTFGFGPGLEEFAHAPDEQITVDHLIRAAAFYAQFTQDFRM